MMNVNKVIAFSIFFMVLFSSCRKSLISSVPDVPYLDTTIKHFDTTTSQIDSTDDGNMLMGNCSNAKSDTLQVNNYLMIKPFYTLSYNSSRSIPNWVSWHIQLTDLGNVTRQDDFRADSTLPLSWYKVQDTSYVNTGFDRGHNCPSADRTTSIAANSSTFLMTNMIPQAPYLNQQTWALFEDSLRLLVQNGFEVFVIMGSYGNGGVGNNGFATTIAGGKIAVPSNVWKVAVVLPNGNQDLKRVNASTRVIAVNTPNINTVNRNWKTYRTSVDDIEAVTGCNLLSNLSGALQQVLESRVDNL